MENAFKCGSGLVLLCLGAGCRETDVASLRPTSTQWDTLLLSSRSRAPNLASPGGLAVGCHGDRQRTLHSQTASPVLFRWSLSRIPNHFAYPRSFFVRPAVYVCLLLLFSFFSILRFSTFWRRAWLSSSVIILQGIARPQMFSVCSEGLIIFELHGRTKLSFDLWIMRHVREWECFALWFEWVARTRGITI